MMLMRIVPEENWTECDVDGVHHRVEVTAHLHIEPDLFALFGTHSASADTHVAMH